MSRKAKLWVGATIVMALAINYVIIGAPLIRRSEALKVEMRSVVIKFAKSDVNFMDMENDYLLQVFRKEQSVLNRQILILNCVSATLALLAVSWTVFGLLHSRK